MGPYKAKEKEMGGELTINMYADWTDRSEAAKKRFFYVVRLVRFMMQLNMLHNVNLVDTNNHARSIKIRPWKV